MEKEECEAESESGAVLMLMMHINMWLACFDEANALNYYSEVRRLAEMNGVWLREGAYYSLQAMEQMSSVFKETRKRAF